MLGKMEGKEQGVTEDETVGWHCQLNGCGFEQTPGDKKEQGIVGSTGSQRVGLKLVTEQQVQRPNFC